MDTLNAAVKTAMENDKTVTLYLSGGQTLSLRVREVTANSLIIGANQDYDSITVHVNGVIAVAHN